MADEENQAPVAAEGGDKPVKKKTSVKVVRRVKSKKSEKGERPELAPPPPTIEEQSAPAAATEPAAAGDSAAAATTTTTKQQVDLGSKTNGISTPTTTTTTSRAREESRPVERRVSSKKRAHRSGSNVFAMFTQNQVAQFKEAFGFIDQDKDGIISKSDIRATFDALGRLCSDKELEEMTSEAPGPINFTMFLSVFGDRIQGADDEDVVLDAFNRYDEGDGFCKEDK